jgi:spore maturation protein CgeD
MNPKVSVILTSYNKPAFLEKAIKSVLSQTYDNYCR